MVKCLDLVGVFMIIFIKSSIRNNFSKFDYQIIKTGLMGAMGNKGSCIIRFNYHDTTFAFSSGHFAAGSSANHSRISEMVEILNKNFPLYKDLKFKEHTIAVIFGDLNFRIDMEYNECLNCIKNKNLSQLTQYDQFLKSKEVNFQLSDIEEGPLNFNPTYKYVIGSHDYDKKKKRIPSWCDRVFYKKSKFLTQISYNRVDYLFSDHRPIYSIFHVHAIKEISEKKTAVINQIKENIILGTKLLHSFENESTKKQHHKNEDIVENKSSFDFENVKYINDINGFFK